MAVLGEHKCKRIDHLGANNSIAHRIIHGVRDAQRTASQKFGSPAVVATLSAKSLREALKSDGVEIAARTVGTICDVASSVIIHIDC